MTMQTNAMTTDRFESPQHLGYLRRVAVASAAGATVEWYDFFLYAAASAVVFNRLFFPDLTPTAGLLASLSTYAVGFLARPLGAVIFGAMGDRIGRRQVLLWTMLLMGGGTFLIGCLPTYGAIGFLAPVLLVLLRLCQGFGLGGEYGGAVLLVAENAPRNRRGYYASMVQVGVPIGILLSSAILTLFTSLPEDQFLSWGWRVPFLASALIVVPGLLIRFKMDETPYFQKVVDQDATTKAPLREVLSEYKRRTALIIGIRVSESACLFLFATFPAIYLKDIGELANPKQTVFLGSTIGAVLLIGMLPVFARLSDRVGRRPVYIFGAALMGVLGVAFFALAGTGNPVLVIVAIIIAYIADAAMYGPQAAFLTELFPTRIRYTGVSLGQQIGAVFGGALAPIIAVALLDIGVGFWPVSLYVLAIATMTGLCAYWLPETVGADLARLD